MNSKPLRSQRRRLDLHEDPTRTGPSAFILPSILHDLIQVSLFSQRLCPPFLPLLSLLSGGVDASYLIVDPINLRDLSALLYKSDVY